MFRTSLRRIIPLRCHPIRHFARAAHPQPPPRNHFKGTQMNDTKNQLLLYNYILDWIIAIDLICFASIILSYPNSVLSNALEITVNECI